ncbi:uncharacterized protein LOC132720065 isoform X2 [Ruditapes philippinarum]|uniref:uncharacterized protein LOC132720065 isoform X2 n=1 Tax=Ruditapes philippinarum TaxID=129788 RepID=UPI00295ACA79|nr:uncharacterized protein LOC132720065 isoform X2 [Ruditapes philippinarum]
MAEAGSRSRAERQGSTVDEIFKCSICQHEMEDSSMTLCGHRYCTKCIKEWMKRKQNCPQCRQPVTLSFLIEDKSFKEIKRKYKEVQEQSENNQRGQGYGMSVEELGNILQSVMPQRDQDMRNLTDNLISMKDQEISRLEQNKREQTATISRLNNEIERVKGQLGDELPTLTERSTHLQNKVDTLTEQNRQFQEKIRTLEASLTSLKIGSSQAQQHRKILEELLKAKTKEMLTVKAQFDGVNKENLHLKLQLQSTKDDLKSQKEQLEKSETTTTQLKELLDKMFQQKQLSDDEIERLKGQLGDDLPTLTERSTHLQNKVDTLTEQNRQFQDKNRTLEASLASLEEGSLQAQQHRKNLEEQLKAKTKEMLTVKAQFDGVNKENLHLKLQLQSTKDDLKSQKEQLEKSETTTTQLKELLDQMFQQKQLSDAELDASRQMCLQLAQQVKELHMYEVMYSKASQQLDYLNNTVVPQKDSAIDQLQQKITDLITELDASRQRCLQLAQQVKELHMYEVMYSKASQQLDYLNNTVVPQKDSAIDQLQQKITDLINEVADLQRNNIPQAEHVEILQTRLAETRQELKQYYEDEYGTKMASLERRNEAMKKHVTEMETELKNREDVGDELKAATRTYKGLIKENCDLKDKVKTLEKQNKHVAHYKERANKLERQISFLRNRIEE